MRFTTVISVALAATGVVGSNWFTKAAYNKWHETELERWLSDHDIPYPTPADRKDLEKLIEKNWNDYVVTPYNSWDADTLSAYLKAKGVESQNAAAQTKDSLVAQVKDSWYETGDQAQQAWANTKDWFLDTWTESTLKEFCDKNGIPVPQPRKRDTLLQQARLNYEALAKKAGEATSYPGNWLYDTWSESDLKEWLDTNGFPAPQPTTRDKLVASVRRNSRLAYLKMQAASASATASAQAAYATLTDMIIDAWSESQLKDFCDKNAIPVPQGTKLNELRALVRKHRAELLGDTVSASAASAYGAATSNAGNQYAKATDAASRAYQEAFNEAIDTWSESRLKAYLDARGVPVPHASKKDELRALVRKHRHEAANTINSWSFEEFSFDNLKDYLAANGDAAAKKISQKSKASRDDLVSAAQSAYTSASKAGGSNYASMTSYITQATATAKKNAFDTWSESELKSYLDSYGVPVPQGSKVDELRAYARRQYTYFKYGTTTPSETLFAKVSESFNNAWNWLSEQWSTGSAAAEKQAADAKAKAKAAKDEL